jgi:hypothetical protein
MKGYGIECEIEIKEAFTQDGVERQQANVNKIRSHGH